MCVCACVREHQQPAQNHIIATQVPPLKTVIIHYCCKKKTMKYIYSNAADGLMTLSVRLKSALNENERKSVTSDTPTVS